MKRKKQIKCEAQCFSFPIQSISKQLSLTTWFSLGKSLSLFFKQFFWSSVLVQRRRMNDGQLYVKKIAVIIKMHYSKCISFLSIVRNSIKRFLGSVFFLLAGLSYFFGFQSWMKMEWRVIIKLPEIQLIFLPFIM